MLQDEEPIAQLQYWLNSYSKYNIPPKALPLLVFTKNTALGDVSQDKYSTRLCLVLYLSLIAPPCAVFSIQTRGSALYKVSHLCCLTTPSVVLFATFASVAPPSGNYNNQ